MPGAPRTGAAGFTGFPVSRPPWPGFSQRRTGVQHPLATAAAASRLGSAAVPCGLRHMLRSQEEASVTTRLFASPLFLGFDHLEHMLERASKTSAAGYPPY